MSQTIEPSRRFFFKTFFLCLAGGFSVKASGGLTANPNDSEVSVRKLDAGGGYRETDHIRNYYEKARF